MHKKIIAICAALVALAALAIPAAASAAVTLRENGTTVPTGTKILATQDMEGEGANEAIFAAGSGENEIRTVCTTNEMTGTLVTNNGTTVEGTIEKASFKGEQTENKCAGGFLLGNTKVRIPALTNEGGTGHWCMKNVSGEDKFELIGANCGTKSGTLTFILEGNLTCIYTRTSSVTGDFTTTTGSKPSTLTVTGEPTFTKEEGSSFFCPTEGKIKQMKFTLSTDNEAKTPLQLDDVS